MLNAVALWPLYLTLAVHIAAGFLGMYSGLVPVFTRKGGAAHRRWGWVFTWAMGIAAGTAIPLAYWRQDWLQASIGVLSGYLAWLGVRALRPESAAKRYVVLPVAALFFSFMLFTAVTSASHLDAGTGRTGLFFGLLGCLVAVREAMIAFTQRSFRARILDHLLATSLAWLCGFASFLNTQLHRITGWDWEIDARMLLPFAVAAPLLLVYAWRWWRRLASAQRTSDIEQQRERSEISRLRLFALAEGTSFLALVGIAVPLKHLGDMPELVRVLGPIHGALFVLYSTAVLLAARALRWKARDTALALIAGILPAGTFFWEARLRRTSAGG